MPFIKDFDRLKADKAYRAREARKAEVCVFMTGVLMLPALFYILFSESASMLFALLPLVVFFFVVSGQNPLQTVRSGAGKFIGGFMACKTAISEIVEGRN